MDEDILNSMLKNACATADNDFVICILRAMQSKQIEPQQESIKLIEEYQQQVFRNLRTQRVHSKKTRNDCFKLTRECKQFLRHFQLNKRSENKLSKGINVPIKSEAKLKRNQTKFIKRNRRLEEKEKQTMDESRQILIINEGIACSSFVMKNNITGETIKNIIESIHSVVFFLLSMFIFISVKKNTFNITLKIYFRNINISICHKNTQ